MLVLNYDCYTPKAFWLVYSAQFGFASMGIRHVSWYFDSTKQSYYYIAENSHAILARLIA